MTPQQLRMFLLAAISARVPLPSETLRQMGHEFPFDWRKLNAFQAAYPIRITHDEEGNPLPGLAPGQHQPIAESDEELELRG